MSSAVQQGAHVGLVPPGDVYYQHACRRAHTHTQVSYTCVCRQTDRKRCVHKQQQVAAAARKQQVRLTV